MKEKLIKARQLIDQVLAILDESEEPNIIRENSEDKEFSILKTLLESDAWPEAVFKFQIADENLESDKEERAEGIADIMLPPAVGKKFLDFGCGEGHVVKYVSNEALFSVGYDIMKSTKSILSWEERQEKFLLTTDLDRVKKEGPYDMILVYDVLDHVSNPVEVLSLVKSLLADGGFVYLRCHPWCGRHGGHIYKSINKAFVHLVFDEDELKRLGVPPEFTNKITYPLKNYDEFIRASGMEVTEREVETQEVEDFFSEEFTVKARILRRFGVSEWRYDPPAFQMSQCFIDYVLHK